MKDKRLTLKTKRLILKPLTDIELEERIATAPDPEMKKALGEMLAGCKSDPDNRIWYTEWAFILKETGRMIGSLDFKGPENRGEVELGYGTDEEYRCKGYTTEAVKAAIEWAFSQNGDIYYITAETAPDNQASRRVLEKAGFRPSGWDGEEGPRFELERPATNWMSIGMCLGMSLGLCFSSINIGIGLAVGMCLGLAIGACVDFSVKAKLKDARAEHIKNKTVDENSPE